jgi:GNAT superfamily N-acetyltransferase
MEREPVLVGCGKTDIHNCRVERSQFIPIRYNRSVTSRKTPFGVNYKDDLLGIGTIAWVYSVWTAPMYRKRGVAAYLYAALEHQCRAKGINQIWLDVFADNQPSHSMHRSLGFKPAYLLYSKIVPK